MALLLKDKDDTVKQIESNKGKIDEYKKKI